MSYEEILGIINPGFGSTRTLVFTSSRIIVAKTVSSFIGIAGAVVGFFVGSLLFNLLGGIVIATVLWLVFTKLAKPKYVGHMPPDEILKNHRSNFEIPYTNIVRVDLRRGTLTVLTAGGRKRFSIADGKIFQSNVSIVRRALPDKLATS